MKKIKMMAGEHAVLLIHGLQGTPVEMQSIAKRLNKVGYSVRVPHFKGYGYSAEDTSHSVTPWQDWRHQVLHELREMKKQYQTVSVCGLCIGAVLALSVAEEASAEINGLSLLSTTMFYNGWSIPWYRFLLPLGYYTPFRHIYRYKGRRPFGIKNGKLQQWLIRELNHKASSIAAAANLSIPAIHEAELLIKSVKRNLHKVTTPTLIIHAQEDDVSSPRSADYVTTHIGSDIVHRVMLHDSYHLITMDNERELVADEVIKFIDGLVEERESSFDVEERSVLSCVPRLSLVHSA